MKRRSFLKGSAAHLALSSSSVYALQNLIDISFSRNLVFAQEATRNHFVHFQMSGAPPRWMFDLPINPNNNNAEVVSGTFGTEIGRSGGRSVPLLRGYPIDFGGRRVWMPPVWTLQSAASGENFSSLLAETIMVRGIDMEINSHNVNRQRLLRPVASEPSIHGLIADKGHHPLPAMGIDNTDASRCFRSERGQSLLQFNAASPIAAVTQAFSKPSQLESENPRHMAQALHQLDQYAERVGLASMGADQQQKAAYDMFSRNLENFQDQWQGLYSKYRTIIRQEMRAPFAGITSTNPSGDGSAYFAFDTGNHHTGPLSSLINNGTNIDRMAQSFAFAEFALGEGLSTALNLDAFQGGRMIAGLNGQGNLTADQHRVGVIIATYFSSLMYRCFLGCMLEFRRFLQARGLYDKTLIHVSAEFSRTPRTDGSGSDHGFNGSSATLMGGMIATPGLVGNLKRQPEKLDTTRYPGTFGEAGGFIDDGNGPRPLYNDDLVNTICEALEIRKVAVKGLSLVRKTGNQLHFLQNWEARNV
jgi:hypothetical protein